VIVARVLAENLMDREQVLLQDALPRVPRAEYAAGDEHFSGEPRECKHCEGDEGRLLRHDCPPSADFNCRTPVIGELACLTDLRGPHLRRTPMNDHRECRQFLFGPDLPRYPVVNNTNIG
jgi:hypothetical protein